MLHFQTLKEAQELLPYLTTQELEEMDLLLNQEIWVPLPGPQTEALNTEADELFYGGAGGGGKSELLIGASLTRHRDSLLLRREGTQMRGIINRMMQIIGSKDGYNGQERVWRYGEKLIEFGSCPNLGDEQRYMGRPHSLIGFDEITHFTKNQYVFLSAWLRTADEGERCRVIATGNPPTDPEGDWVLEHWGAWLNPNHRNPAEPGELRYYGMLGGVEVELENGEPYEDETGTMVKPKSRTFIPARVEDNPYYMATGYRDQLASLPEPFRSMMLKGDFHADKQDHERQVIPTAWVEAAMSRWEKKDAPGPLDSLGVDPARGGVDDFVIAKRYGLWFDELSVTPGVEVKDGSDGAAMVVKHLKGKAPIHVDLIGIGSSVYDHLKDMGSLQVEPVNWAKGTDELDRTGELRFANERAMDWWRMREALDPDADEQIALPPDDQLKRDLCAPQFKMRASGLLIESKDDIKSRIGRSTDRGDAVVTANRRTRKKLAKAKAIKYDYSRIV